MRKKVQQDAKADDVKPLVMVTDDKVGESGKRPAVDQKQSFVDQVSEGLEKKIPKERFENTAPETPVKDKKDEEAKAGTPPVEVEETNIADDLGADVKEKAPIKEANQEEAKQEEAKEEEDKEEEAKEEEAKEEEAKEEEAKAKETAVEAQEEVKIATEEEKASEPAADAQEEAKADADAPIDTSGVL